MQEKALTTIKIISEQKALWDNTSLREESLINQSSKSQKKHKNQSK